MLFSTRKESDGGIIACVSYAQRDLAQRCGFRWDFLKKAWITYDPRIAARATWSNIEAADVALQRDREVRKKHLEQMNSLQGKDRRYKTRDGSWKIR